MPQVLRNENEIKEVLADQLCKLRTINMDPRASSHNITRLRSSLNFDEEERNKKLTDMWRTGQVPMEVNTMPGLVSNESG